MNFVTWLKRKLRRWCAEDRPLLGVWVTSRSGSSWLRSGNAPYCTYDPQLAGMQVAGYDAYEVKVVGPQGEPLPLENITS